MCIQVCKHHKYIVQSIELLQVIIVLQLLRGIRWSELFCTLKHKWSCSSLWSFISFYQLSRQVWISPEHTCGLGASEYLDSQKCYHKGDHIVHKPHAPAYHGVIVSRNTLRCGCGFEWDVFWQDTINHTVSLWIWLYTRHNIIEIWSRIADCSNFCTCVFKNSSLRKRSFL